MRCTIWETQISSSNFQALMLVESLVVSVVTSGLPVASIRRATDDHCENHISIDWHQHQPTRFSKKSRISLCWNQLKCFTMEHHLLQMGYSVWFWMQTFPDGNRWGINLKVLWIRSLNIPETFDPEQILLFVLDVRAHFKDFLLPQA